MSVHRFLWVLLLLPLQGADVAALEALTAQWVELRGARAAEAEAWRDEEARLRLELRLLEDTERGLLAERDALVQSADAEETRQAELHREQGELDARLNGLAPAIADSATAFLARLDTLPPAVRNALAAEASALRAETVDPLPRLRALLSLSNQLLLLQTQLRAESLVMEDGGRRREMQVLWIGTAAAFALSGDGDVLRGGLDPSGTWSWRSHPVDPATLASALAIVRREAPPVLVRLPVEAPR